MMTSEEITVLAEKTAETSLSRRDGIVWGHDVLVRPGKRCPVVVQLESCHSVKAWAARLTAELRSRGMNAVMGKCHMTYHNSASTIPAGWGCWISILE